MLVTAKAARDLRFRGQERDFDDFIRRLVSIEPVLPSNAFKGMVPNKIQKGAKSYIKQRLVSFINSPDIRSELIKGFAGVHTQTGYVIPIPEFFHEELLKKEWKINETASAIAFNGLLKTAFRDGIRRFVGLSFIAFRTMLTKRHKSINSDIVLMNMHTHTLPPKLSGDKTFELWDFVSWFRRSKLNVAGSRLWIHHLQAIDVSERDIRGLSFINTPWPFPVSPVNYVMFILHCLVLSAKAWLGYWRGEWWKVIILREAIDTAYIQALGHKRLPEKFIFNNTVHSVRPLWTYLAEWFDCDIQVAHYSHNFQDDFDPENIDRSLVSPHILLYSWNKAAVWTQFHADSIDRFFAGTVKCDIVGPVGFSDSADEVIIPEDKISVAVFDLPVRRDALAYRGIKLSSYQNQKTVIKYLTEVLSVIDECGCVIVLKPKQYYGMAQGAPHQKWDKMITVYKNLIEKYDCVLVPYGVSAMRISTSADITIGIPFTSTASAAYLLGKPATYYDPTGTLGDYVHLSQGCNILYERSALKTWLQAQVKNIRDSKHL